MADTHKHAALYALYDSVVSVKGDDNGIRAYDANGDLVSYDTSAVDTKATEIETAEKLDMLRAERNKLLAQTDWEIVRHKELSTNIPTALKTYRQALRDITNTYSSLDDVVWPEKP